MTIMRSMCVLVLVVTVMLVPAAASAANVRASDDAFTDSGNPTTNYGSDADLAVKIVSGATGSRTYISFNLTAGLVEGLSGADITAASLRLWVNRVTAGGTFDVYEVASGWTEETITANNAPSLGTRRKQDVSVSSSDVRKFLTIDLTTLVRDWIDGTVTNYGIALVPVSDVDAAFDSKENTGTGHDPTLQVMVNLVPDITAVLTPSGGGLTGGGTSGSLSLSIQSTYKLPQACANNQVAKWNASSSTWGCADDVDTNSGGDITGVYAGSGLGGGGSSGEVTLYVADAGIGTAKIANSAVNTDKLADNAVTAAKIAPGEVVKSLNGLKDAVTLAAGSGIDIQSSSNTLTISATNTGGAHGQVRLRKNGSNLELCPYNGNQIIVDSVSITLSGNCVSLGTSGLSANTTYYIYLYLNSGTQTLLADQTGWSFSGAGIAVKTGDTAKTLVGMARTNGSTAWQDAAAQRFVRSWFNSPSLQLVGANLGCQTSGYTGTAYAEVFSSGGARAEFLAWADEVVDATNSIGAGNTNGSNAGFGFVSVGVDGADGEDAGVATFGPDTAVSRSGIGRRVVSVSEGHHYITPTWRNDRANSTVFCSAYGGRVQGVLSPAVR